MARAGQVGAQAGQSLTISWQTFSRIIAAQTIVRAINAIIQALGAASRAAAEFEIATARIANITDEGVAGINSLRDSIRQLAVTTGRDLGEVTTAALEALQNDLGTTAETFELLTGAADNLAKATGTELVSAVNSISSVLKSFNQDTSQAADVADALFVAFDKGRVSMSELESRLGTILPQVNTLGVVFPEAAAAVASLTLSGLNSATAMTQLRNVLDKLIRPTEDLKAAFETLGVTSGPELIEKFGGLQGALAALKGAFGDNELAIAKAFGTIRGQLGVLNLLANEGTNFTNVLEAMDNRLGEVKAAADTVNQTTTQQINQQFAQLSNTLLPVGDALNRLKLDSLTFINDFVAGLSRLQQRQDFQKLTQFATNFGTAFISVIDDIIAKLDQLFGIIASGASKAIAILDKITNPVGTAETTRIETIRADMVRLSQTAATEAQKIRDAFAQRGPTNILGDQQKAFDDLARLEQQARIFGTTLRAQLLANEARIRANTQAAEAFRASLQAATAAPLFGNTEQLRLQNAQLREISALLTEIQTKSATATAAEQTDLQQLLAVQQQKINEKAKELGVDNKAVQALQGQLNATRQILNNQQGKAENEAKVASAAELANQALQSQQTIAQQAGVSLEQLGISGSEAGKAIEAIPDPTVDASAAIAQMNALEAAARAAAAAVAAANSGGGGSYHGGYVHRASGGNTRGQDTVPTLLSPGEFVMNKRSTGRFFSQLQAINAGQSASFRESGGAVTNIGDINVNVTGGVGGESPTQTARQIASGLRRELRRKTSRLS
ncbi:MAG: phage tail tape measure protein [Nitrososphaera sp.]|nr:phage tail tape measure protein [Nitrososphaera sp.]